MITRPCPNGLEDDTDSEDSYYDDDIFSEDDSYDSMPELSSRGTLYSDDSDTDSENEKLETMSQFTPEDINHIVSQTKNMYSDEIDTLLYHLKRDTLLPTKAVENLSKCVKDIVQKHNDIIESTFALYLSEVAAPQVNPDDNKVVKPKSTDLSKAYYSFPMYCTKADETSMTHNQDKSLLAEKATYKRAKKRRTLASHKPEHHPNEEVVQDDPHDVATIKIEYDSDGPVEEQSI